MFGFKSIIMIIFIIGLVIVVRELTRMSFKCPVPDIEYKYMPRTLDLDLKDSKDVDAIFKTMFQASEPWIGTSRADSAKIRKIAANKLTSLQKL